MGGNSSTQSSCNGTWTAANHNTWNGCITDRGDLNAPDSGNYDTNVVAPTTQHSGDALFSGELLVLPRRRDGSELQLDEHDDGGQQHERQRRHQPGHGLAWGWLSLVGGGPFTVPPMASGYQYSQVIILLTDGLNTQDRWYTNSVVHRRASADDLHQHQKLWHHSVHDPGQYRRRSDVDPAPELRVRFRASSSC